MSEHSWLSRASCRGHWSNPDRGDLGWDDLTVDEQLTICTTCPVLTDCAADVTRLTATGKRPVGIVQAGHLYHLNPSKGIKR